MKKRLLWLSSAVLFAMILSGCTQQTKLFNERNLEGWETFLGDLDTNPATVWSVQDGVLRCEGMPYGYIRTVNEYSNYELHLEWRWADKPSNSGVLLHITGEDNVWPKSIEAQLMHQNAGDLLALGTSFGEFNVGGHIPKQHKTNEKEPGQWNAYDIICQNDTITLYVNGLLQNTVANTSVSCGKIGLQCEGSPIEFRNIVITPK